MRNDVKTVRLGIERYQAAQLMDWPFAEPPEVDVAYRAEYAGAMLVQMIQRIAVQTECVARYPKDWVQAVKARWAPEWFKRRYPVQEHVIDLKVLYPKVALPRQGHVVTIHEYDLHPSWGKDDE